MEKYPLRSDMPKPTLNEPIFPKNHGINFAKEILPDFPINCHLKLLKKPVNTHF